MAKPKYLGIGTGTSACHLCGRSTALSRAHVPPQCAGNTAEVTRSKVMVHEYRVRQTSPKIGGLWLKTLCRPCNGEAAQYDEIYGDFASKLGGATSLSGLLVPSRKGVPAVNVAPGWVIRSVLHGFVAVAPAFRSQYPEFVENLRTRQPDLRLPDGLVLRVARTQDTFCRLSSAYHMHRVLGRRVDHPAFAEIYFAPLAWVLTHSDGGEAPRLVDVEGWGDATDWLQYGLNVKTIDLRLVLNALPLVRHPARGSRADWVELSSPVSYLLEGRAPRVFGRPASQERLAR